MWHVCQVHWCLSVATQLWTVTMSGPGQPINGEHCRNRAGKGGRIQVPSTERWGRHKGMLVKHGHQGLVVIETLGLHTGFPLYTWDCLDILVLFQYEDFLSINIYVYKISIKKTKLLWDTLILKYFAGNILFNLLYILLSLISSLFRSSPQNFPTILCS